eukprot:1557014-Pleurochrysis_carterae.AAC.1
MGRTPSNTHAGTLALVENAVHSCICTGRWASAEMHTEVAGEAEGRTETREHAKWPEKALGGGDGLERRRRP